MHGWATTVRLCTAGGSQLEEQQEQGGGFHGAIELSRHRTVKSDPFGTR